MDTFKYKVLNVKVFKFCPIFYKFIISKYLDLTTCHKKETQGNATKNQLKHFREEPLHFKIKTSVPKLSAWEASNISDVGFLLNLT